MAIEPCGFFCTFRCDTQLKSAAGVGGDKLSCLIVGVSVCQCHSQTDSDKMKDGRHLCSLPMRVREWAQREEENYLTFIAYLAFALHARGTELRQCPTE